MGSRHFFALAGFASMLGAAAACSSFGDDPVDAGTPDATTPEASDGAIQGSDAAGDGGPEAGGRPGMVLVTGASRPFYIDETEVTYDRYEAFRQTSPTFSSEPRCAWKTSATTPCTASTGTLPVRCIDWCDALAYCKSAGKRLCGGIGGGSITEPDKLGSGLASQWLFACAGGAATDRWAYGLAYRSGVCNEASSGAVPVKSLPDCVGATAGVYDLSGNVKEWDDSCLELDGGPDAAKHSSCAVRGGSFTGPTAESKCGNLDMVVRYDTYDDVGFRCCAD
ncbi:MAG: SUMF1/EgtB/PvdO family nonheme iron enzyme [Deltaproteobacteria bacterium]|nr:SUMF1/EgtB/PvdO family nonheme iron enzyme [Deltaproteobacteria bacterium]